MAPYYIIGKEEKTLNRDSEYNATKLTSISNGKTIIDTYVDSFDIEKVKITVAELEGSKRRISMYIDFADFMRLTMQVKSQSYLINKIRTAGPLEICRGGNSRGSETNVQNLISEPLKPGTASRSI